MRGDAVARWWAACLIIAGVAAPAHAEFTLSSAIIEFGAETAKQQDVELISRSPDSDYIVSEIYEVTDAGAATEGRRLIEDVTESGLLVTPDKTVLPPGGRQVLRFVLLKELDDKEHLYRVAIKPVIRDIATQSRVGLKILVGYEALVIVRPKVVMPNVTLKRDGKILYVSNGGNGNIFLQSGQQCVGGDCKPLPSQRVYAQESSMITLPLDAPLTYSVWDGVKMVEQSVP